MQFSSDLLLTGPFWIQCKKSWKDYALTLLSPTYASSFSHGPNFIVLVSSSNTVPVSPKIQIIQSLLLEHGIIVI